MSKVLSELLPVKLFIGMLSQDIPLLDEIKEKLIEIFGPIDLKSPVWEWNHTDYYLKEMGDGLKRQFVFFKELIKPDAIAEIKLKTIELEKQHLKKTIMPTSQYKGEEKLPLPHPPPSRGGGEGEGEKVFSEGKGRRINLDPGYMDTVKIVLASTKDFSHRIYLGKGIYGEVTLIYSGKGYQILPYTFPDFRTQEYQDIFKKAREIYKKS